MSFDAEKYIMERAKFHGKFVTQDDDCFIMRNGFKAKAIPGMKNSWLCGYAAVKTSEVKKEADTVEVHGGVTFTDTWNGYTIYGFDTIHGGDEDYPELDDESVIMKMCQEMKADMKGAI